MRMKKRSKIISSSFSIIILSIAFIITAQRPHTAQIAFNNERRPLQLSPGPFRLRHALHIGTHNREGLLKRRDYYAADIAALTTGGSAMATQFDGISIRPFIARRPQGGAAAILEFAQRSRNAEQTTILEFGDEHLIPVPDVEDKNTILNIAKLTYNAYNYPDNNMSNWYDVSDIYNNSTPFGWDEDGIRGHFFATDDNSTVIIALKGTSAGKFGTGGPTEGNDRINDNLLFSCCCAREGWSWPTVCDCYRQPYQCSQNCLERAIARPSSYYEAIVDLFNNATEILFPDPKTRFWVVGHSLGGALSSLMGLTFGIPAVTFQAPGEKLAARRLHLPSPPAFPDEYLPTWHIGHTADPIFMGVCNGVVSSCWVGGYAMESMCHLGKTCVYDTITDKGWALDTRTHRIQQVIDKVLTDYDDVPACEPEEECMDCSSWEFITENDT